MLLFNKEIELKTHYCKLFDYEPYPVEEPYVNIQVQLKGCNANCSFCEYKGSGNFNEDEYFRKLKLISEQVKINKINFTGGEPTLNFERLERLIYKTRDLFPNNYIVLNTNGYNYEKIFKDLYKCINNIQLSRHHYNDDINNKILGFKSVSGDVIKDIASGFEEKRFLNLSCNLINGYIDNKDEIYKYIEEASNLNIKWVGFVTLIPLNQFCIENQIKFEDMDFESDRSILTKHWTLGNKCQCYNYVYIPKDLSDPVRVYNKRTEKSETKWIFVYDGENFNIGFSNNILI